MKKDSIRFALVGCGRIAERHAEHIHNKGILQAVCDIDYAKAQKIGELYQAKSYYNIDSLLQEEKELDIVSITTPNGLHAEHAIKCLKAGLHVVCEKPMAITVTDCGNMITEAEKANRHLFVIKQNRFNPPVVALKKILNDGRLGKTLSVQLNCFWNRNEKYYLSSNWKGRKDLDGGTLFTQFSHFIDLMYWLVGDVRKVYALTGNFAHQKTVEFEDTGVVALEFFNGAMGTINYTVNSYKKNMEGSITIFGERGTVKVGGQYLNELEYQSIEGYEIKDIPQGNPPNHYGQYQGSMSNHDKVYDNVIDVLINGGIIATNGLEGMKTVEIIDKIYMSAAQNNRI